MLVRVRQKGCSINYEIRNVQYQLNLIFRTLQKRERSDDQEKKEGTASVRCDTVPLKFFCGVFKNAGRNEFLL